MVTTLPHGIAPSATWDLLCAAARVDNAIYAPGLFRYYDEVADRTVEHNPEHPALMAALRAGASCSDAVEMAIQLKFRDELPSTLHLIVDCLLAYAASDDKERMKAIAKSEVAQTIRMSEGSAARAIVLWLRDVASGRLTPCSKSRKRAANSYFLPRIVQACIEQNVDDLNYWSSKGIDLDAALPFFSTAPSSISFLFEYVSIDLQRIERYAAELSDPDYDYSKGTRLQELRAIVQAMRVKLVTASIAKKRAIS